MKRKICISVDATTLRRLQEGIASGRFRNRSHAFEYALQQTLEGER